MDELPPDVDDFLALARRAQSEPDADVRARVRRGVAAALAGGAVVAGATHAAAATRVGMGIKAHLTLGLAAKLATAATVCAVAVGVLVTGHEPTPKAAPRPAVPAMVRSSAPVEEAHAVPAVAADAEVALVPQPARAAEPAVVLAPPSTVSRAPRTAVTSRTAATPRAAVTPSLAAELALLDIAERALDDGAAARALRLLARHRARYAQSSFRDEREGLTLIARCMLDRDATAAEATRFLARARASVLQARIESACGVSP